MHTLVHMHFSAHALSGPKLEREGERKKEYVMREIRRWEESRRWDRDRGREEEIETKRE